jgi:integrase
MLALTGQRRNEVAGARWSEIDLKEKLWTIPAERMKAGAAHAERLMRKNLVGKQTERSMSAFGGSRKTRA